MTDFKIRRGLSTVLFSAPGVINPKLVIEAGCWYLCTDTAELFLGVFENENNTLKRINGIVDKDYNEFYELINKLDKELTDLKDVELFKKITDESELPENFLDPDFDPNIVYFKATENNCVSTYIFDKDVQCYVCTNNADTSVIYDIVDEAISLTLEQKLDEKIPVAIEKALDNIIIYGGTAAAAELEN